MKIKPYLETVEGIRTFLNTITNIETDFFFLEDVEKLWRNDQNLLKGYSKKQAVIAVGPEAVLFINSKPLDKSIFKVFTMISNPVSLISQEQSSLCGFFLSVDAKKQVTWINKVLPRIKSLGILYDQQHNKEYVSRAQETGLVAGIKIKPLMVSSKDEVPELLRKNWNRMDGLLLIPDATVISASLVKYIIKDGISNNVPVIGYNRYFIRSGALMAFEYDYKQIGRQTGLLVRELLLNDAVCRSIAAEFRIVINSSIATHLDMDVTRELEGAVIEANE